MSSFALSFADNVHQEFGYRSGDGPGGLAPMETCEAGDGPCFNNFVEPLNDNYKEGDNEFFQHSVVEGLSAWSTLLPPRQPLASVTVDDHGNGHDMLHLPPQYSHMGAWGSMQQEPVLGGEELLPLSLRGPFPTSPDTILIISETAFNLTELKIPPGCDYHPASLAYLKRLPYLRRLVVDASMCCCFMTGDLAEYLFEDMLNALTELCRGPFGCGGHVTLQYTCVDEDDVLDGFNELEVMEFLVQQRLHCGAQGEGPRVKIEVEWLPATTGLDGQLPVAAAAA